MYPAVNENAEPEFLDLDGRMPVLFAASHFSVHVQDKHSKSLHHTRNMQTARKKVNRDDHRESGVGCPKVGFTKG